MLVFTLTVDDGLAAGTASTTVTISNVNQAPIAAAGSDQTKAAGSLVQLDGSASSDPDGDALSYHWVQRLGPVVALSDHHSVNPTFTAPQVGPGGDVLLFELTVDDGQLPSAPDEVIITVQDVNDPPICELAQATPDTLWPPTHKTFEVAIVGVTDPNNQQVILTITGVTADEPVQGLGDGDTSPDAILQGATVLLRAERAGGGNGRVYAVAFSAEDPAGGRCTGAVQVCVPHDKKDICQDDGQRYNATQP